MWSTHFNFFAACAVVLSVNVAATVSTINCPGGTYWNGNNCQDCQGGQYSPGGDVRSCTTCKANEYSSSKSTSCTTCPDGKYSQAGWSSCQDCSAGKYSTNGSGCLSCASGTVSQQGAASCYPCAAGYYANSNGNGCQECSAGSYGDVAGLSECKKCKPGYWQEKQAKTYCDICPCGTWNSRDGATKCDNCGNLGTNYQATSYQGAVSRDYCFVAPEGFYVGSDNCPSQCPTGTYSNTKAATSCTSCQSGQVAGAGSTKCTTCGTGTKPDATKATCTPTSTGGMRRRDRSPLCPPGHKACPLATGGSKYSFECIDVSSDLLSCGGCPETGEGEDCTTFDPLADAACVKGRCQYRCPQGYNLTSTGCRSLTAGRELRRKIVHAGYKLP